MGSKNETVDKDKAIVLAREALVRARQQIPKLRDAVTDSPKVSEIISEASGMLQTARFLDPSDQAYTTSVCDVMDLLGQALEIMQAADIDDPVVTAAARDIAQTLAVLHPASNRQAPESLRPRRPALVKPKPPPGAERRASPRVEIDAGIGFQAETNFYTGFAGDLSTGGIFLATYDTKPIGSRLHLNFTLPDGHLVSTAGIVRWVREYNELTPGMIPGMGLQFESLDPRDEAAIYRFIEQRQPMFYED